MGRERYNRDRDSETEQDIYNDKNRDAKEAEKKRKIRTDTATESKIEI